MNKFDLFRYWQSLEQNLHDPVEEYNKGIELFDTHYNPEPNDLFLIILQICRFLKEFSDFETQVTPDFRHPLIKGKVGMKKQNDVYQISELKDVRSPTNQSGDYNQRIARVKSQTQIPLHESLMYNPFYDDDQEVSEIEEPFSDEDEDDETTFNY